MVNPTRQCVILLGGLGTRLGALTKNTPKPLLRVGNASFVEILVHEAVRRGFNDVVFLAGFESEQVQVLADMLGNQYDNRAKFRVCVEREPLGTGGAVRNAIHLLEDTFLLLNGDTWFDFNWLELCMRTTDGMSSFAVRRIPRADRYESVEIDDNGNVLKIIARGQNPRECLINAGVYVAQREHFLLLEGKFSLEDELLPLLVSRKCLMAFEYDGYFIDIGIPETYASAQIEVDKRRYRPALFLDRDGVINKDLGYVGSIERLHWIDGAADAIRHANSHGWYVFVVTNQAGVARGYYSEEDVVRLHAWMAEELRRKGATVDDWRYCPHHPDASHPSYRSLHPWRKPSPGMLMDLANAWPVRLSDSIMIGDKISDLEAGEGAGVSSFLFESGNLHTFLLTALDQRNVIENKFGKD